MMIMQQRQNGLFILYAPVAAAVGLLPSSTGGCFSQFVGSAISAADSTLCTYAQGKADKNESFINGFI